MFSCSHVKAKRRRDHSQPLKSRNMQQDTRCRFSNKTAFARKILLVGNLLCGDVTRWWWKTKEDEKQRLDHYKNNAPENTPQNTYVCSEIVYSKTMHASVDHGMRVWTWDSSCVSYLRVVSGCFTAQSMLIIMFELMLLKGQQCVLQRSAPSVGYHVGLMRWKSKAWWG